MNESGLISPSEEAFRLCFARLDALTASYHDMIGGTNFPFMYEADMAAAKLMACTWLHANAFSHLSEIPYIGSHLIPAECLARAAYEAGITALWLLEPDDWRFREARWLRWDRRELVHEKNLIRDFGATYPKDSERTANKSALTEDRRQQIEALLVAEFNKDGTDYPKGGVPKFEHIVKELEMPKEAYIFYRLLSHTMHSGPSITDSALRRSGNTIGYYMAHSPTEWERALTVVAAALVTPGILFARRLDAKSHTIEVFQDTYASLKEAILVLRASQRVIGGKQ